MLTLHRNKTSFHYCLYQGKTELTDDDGMPTGEYVISYSDPVLMRANVSRATGNTNLEQFGNSLDYDKVIVTAEMNCPIDENSILFIDKSPAKDENGNYLYDFDYVVEKVAKSLNSISIAVKKVNVNDKADENAIG